LKSHVAIQKSVTVCILSSKSSDTTIPYEKNLLKIGSFCLCHGEHAIGDRHYFLAPCEARIPLADTLCGYRTVVLVSSAL